VSNSWITVDPVELQPDSPPERHEAAPSKSERESPMKNFKRVLAVIAASAVLVVGSAAGAMAAVSWKSSSSPLTLAKNGTTVYGYGSFTATGGAGKADGTAKGTNKVKVSSSPKYAGYVKQVTRWNSSNSCAPGTYTDCPSAWNTGKDNDSAHSKSTSWIAANTSTSLSYLARYARGRFYVKLDVSLAIDPSSSMAETNGIKLA
jgi:hypothetical protein